MEQLECTTKSEHRKGAHLTYEERVIIQIRHRDGRSLRSIAQEIGCAPNTVHNELRRGRVLLHNGKRVGYRAVNGQEVYESNREHCGRPSLHESKKAFLSYVVKIFQEIPSPTKCTAPPAAASVSVTLGRRGQRCGLAVSRAQNAD